MTMELSYTQRNIFGKSSYKEKDECRYCFIVEILQFLSRALEEISTQMQQEKQQWIKGREASTFGDRSHHNVWIYLGFDM